MPCFNIVKEIDAPASFRVEQVKSAFDLQTSHVTEHFAGDIAIEGKDWNVGIIVGRSGTGKTSIAREVFGDAYTERYTYGDRPIIDEIAPGASYKEITHAFTSVGFSSPPSWLKPYGVLSQGEQMRVDLARALLSDRDPILFDEFTSVVDREVAKVCAYAVSKAVRRNGRRFIAVSCHDDIIDWLEPDWVYDTNSQTFSFRGHQRTRPPIHLDIYRVNDKQRVWAMFRRYHYLSHDLHNGTEAFAGLIGGRPIAFCATRHFPGVLKLKAVSRLVVLPDYQGIGIGIAFLNRIADRYRAASNRLHLTTSQANLVQSLARHGWQLVRQERSKPIGRSTRAGWLTDRLASKRVVSTFNYTGGTA